MKNTNVKFYGILFVLGVLTLGFSMQTAYGEILTGSNAETSILISFNGDLNYVEYKSTQGISKYFESTLKEFRHGGFFLKNPEFGIPEIVISVHPQVNDKFTLTVQTSLGFERFIVSPLVIDTPKAAEIEDDTPEDGKSKADTILEEYWKNADNTVVRPADEEYPFKLGSTISQHNWIYINKNYDSKIRAYDANSLKEVEDAQITLEFSRVGVPISTYTGETDKFGLLTTSFPLPFPMFHPDFCYEVKITIEKDGQTIYRYDDFRAMNIPDARINTPGYETVQSDKNCNDRDNRTVTTTRDQPFR